MQIARSFVLSISTNGIEVAAGLNGLHVSSYYGTGQLSNDDHNCSPLDFAIGPQVSGSECLSAEPGPARSPQPMRSAEEDPQLTALLQILSRIVLRMSACVYLRTCFR